MQKPPAEIWSWSSRSRRVSPKRRKRSRRHSPEEARGEIIASAVRFLSEHDFRDLTIGELMGDTPLSRPAFYQYFEDLHELIESLLSEVEDLGHASDGSSVDKRRRRADRRATGIAKRLVQTCVDHGPILRAVAEAAPLDERLERTWSAFTGAWDDLVEARIKAQQRDGLISKSLHARRIATALNSLDTALLIAEFGRRPQGDPKAVLETLHHIWVSTLYGELPRKRQSTN